MRRAAIALVLVAACKDRGTISVPLLQPCAGSDAQAIAVYLVRDVDCTTIACGFEFDCTSPGCTSLCAAGYCAPSELSKLTIEPASAGDYALVMTYQYEPGRDDGLACFALHVDADGTRSEQLSAPTDADPAKGASACCMQP